MVLFAGRVNTLDPGMFHTQYNLLGLYCDHFDCGSDHIKREPVASSLALALIIHRIFSES